MSKQRGGTCHVRSNRYRPYCQLIPREQIATKTQQKCECKENHSYTPVKFTWRFVRCCIKGPCHMHHNHEDHSMGSVTVYVTQDITEGHDILQIFHVEISSRNRRNIVKHQQDTSKCQNQKQIKSYYTSAPMEAHTHTVFSNFCGKNMIENIIRDGEKSIAPIHCITMPKDQLPDLIVHHCVLQCLEAHLRHGTSLCSSVFKQIIVSR